MDEREKPFCWRNGENTMNAMTKLTLAIPPPRLANVAVVSNLIIRVEWLEGIRERRTDTVDLSPLINSLKFYRPLRNNPTLFNSIHLIEEGKILAWGQNDEIDMAADSVEQLAEESWTKDDFRDFLNSNNLTHQEAAALLGYTRRQIENYLSGELIPRVVVLACYGLDCRKQRRQTAISSKNIEMLSTTTEAPMGP
jgi:hypothetical protein